MRNFNVVALAVLLVPTLVAQDSANVESRESENDAENIWSLSRISLKIDSTELGGSASIENADFESFYSKVTSRPTIQRFARYRNPEQSAPTLNRRYVDIGEESELEDYDFDAAVRYDDDDDDKYRHGKKGKKKKKKGKKKKKKKKGDDDDDSDEQRKKELEKFKKFVPPFWLGKPKQNGWGSGHVEQVGWIINNQANQGGGWRVAPPGKANSGLDTGGLKWIEGKGWVGSVGAPWRQEPLQQWGPGFGWTPMKKDDDDGGKKGKKGKKKKNKKKKDKKKKKKKGKKKKKKGKKGQDEDPCKGWRREGRGGKDKDKKDKKKKKDKGGGGMMGGWMKDPCDKGPDPWFGWPQKINFIPPPPRGSQIWLKQGWSPKPLKSGWSDYHGWNWKNKVSSGWGVSDLIGVVHL